MLAFPTIQQSTISNNSLVGYLLMIKVLIFTLVVSNTILLVRPTNVQQIVCSCVAAIIVDQRIRFAISIAGENSTFAFQMKFGDLSIQNLPDGISIWHRFQHLCTGYGGIVHIWLCLAPFDRCYRFSRSRENLFTSTVSRIVCVVSSESAWLKSQHKLSFFIIFLHILATCLFALQLNERATSIFDVSH